MWNKWEEKKKEKQIPKGKRRKSGQKGTTWSRVLYSVSSQTLVSSVYERKKEKELCIFMGYTRSTFLVCDLPALNSWPSVEEKTPSNTMTKRKYFK